VAFLTEYVDSGWGNEGFRHLSESECQCLAADNAWLANLTELESCCDDAADPCGPEALKRAILRCRIVDHRNRAAGEALEAYYRLAEAAAKKDLLQASGAEFEQANRHLRLLKERGMRIDLDDRQFDRRLLDLQADRAQLRLAIEQLNGRLRVLLNIDAYDVTPFWPEAELVCRPTSLNLEEEIATGLSMRPDLAGLRIMRRHLNRDTLDAARSMMQQADLSLGGSPEKLCFLAWRKKEARLECELQMRYIQLVQLQEIRTKAAIEEIRQAVYAVEAQEQAVAAATEKAASLRERKVHLKQKMQANGVTYFDVVAAEQEVLQAEGILLQYVAEWKVALAKLRQAQGLLAFECGYSLPCAARCRSR
jgi:outer membrane protein TolC